jgi:hypothetical protein
MYLQSFTENRKTEREMSSTDGREKALATSQGAWPTQRENTSVRRILDDRMTISEAISAVQKIIDGYPNGGAGAGQGYIGASADILSSYPRQTALACANSRTGIARTCKFLPTVADIVAWCEKATEPLWCAAEREARIAAQLAEREQVRPVDPAVVQGFKDLAEQMKRGFEPSPEARIAKEEKNKADFGKRVAEVYAEWGNDLAPTVAGIPVSRELMNLMRSNRGGQ